MYGLPSLQVIIATVSLPILLGIAFVNYRPTWYNIVGLIGLILGTLNASVSYFAFMYDDWKNGRAVKTDEPKPIEKTYTNLNTQGTYAAITLRPRIDAEMLFAKTLREMYNGDLEVNMTERYWVEEKPDGKNSRWQLIGGIGRSDFVAMLDDRWIPAGACQKIGGQGKRFPGDWNIIRAIEHGRKHLPRPSSPTVQNAGNKKESV